MTKAKEILARGRRNRVGFLLLRTAGFSAKETCALLGVSPKTGEWHWLRIQEATGLRSIWQLAEMVRTVPQSGWPV